VKVLLSHAYSRHNAGDAALLSVLIRDVRDVFPDAELTVLMMDEVQPGETFDAVEVRPFPTHWALHRFSSRVAKLGHCLLTLGVTAVGARVPALARRRLIGRRLAEYLRLCRESDLVVCVGGGYLRGKRSWASTFELALLLQPLMLYRWMGVPTVIYAQSVGPFATRVQRWMAGHVLRQVDRVIAREDISVGILASLGAVANVRRSVDSGFAFDTAVEVDLRRRIGASPDRPLVGVTVRQWLDPAGQDRYERAVATMADAAVEEFGASVVFVPQVTSERQGDDDRVAGRRVAARMRRPATVLDDRPDHHTIKAMYGGLDLLVGTRFHSVIFAMTASVPVLAIEYEHKTSGIMKDLGLDEWVHDITTVDGDTLTAALRRLFARRAEIIAQLADRMPSYQARARETKRELLAAVSGREQKAAAVI
jgi:colanic acid/amylovoran biosynthesis protein